MDLIAQLARELNLKAANVEAAVKLIDEGNTIPFISRYRKEATGGMDDVALRALDERLSYLRNLEQRKDDVILLIDAQGKLTPELEQQIREATQLQRVEDLYKPYRKKRMTRAPLRKTPPTSSSRPPTPPRRLPTSPTTTLTSRCAAFPTTACWLSTAASARVSSACA